MATRRVGSGLRIAVDPTTEELAKAYSFPQRTKIQIGVLSSANVTKANLRKTTPQDSKRLLFSQRLEKRGPLTYEIFETVEPPYGLFQRQGVPASKINPIVPVNKEALFWPGARHPVKIVRNHPGIKRNDYWQQAIDMSEPRYVQEGEKVAAEIEASIDI